MAKVKVTLDKDGITEFMRSDDILSVLMEVAETVANNAGPDYKAVEWTRPSRAVANVIDEREDAMFREAAEGNLARAVGRSS